MTDENYTMDEIQEILDELVEEGVLEVCCPFCETGFSRIKVPESCGHCGTELTLDTVTYRTNEPS